MSDPNVQSRFNQQERAETYLRQPDALRHPKAVIRHWSRLALFSIPPVRRLLERQTRPPAETMAHWDTLMSATHYTVYLGGNIDVDLRNSITATLIKYRMPENPAVLDVGCGGGTQARTLASFSRYLGIDVSSHAIEVARSLAAADPRVAFLASDVRSFEAAKGWDAIIFNEVLYYLHTDEAFAQVTRYAGTLNPGGLIIVSMKNDAKSRVIFGSLMRQFEFVDGILWQQKSSVGFTIEISRECPGILVAAMRKKMKGSDS